jgi:SAM-dependent methyltransferase
MNPSSCPVCAAPYTAYVKVVKGVELFACLQCLSFFSPFAPQQPPRDESKWHISVAERNVAWARELFKKLDPGYVLEIGTGIGTVLRAAREAGGDGVGFDIDSASIEYGRSELGLDLRAEYWTCNTELPIKPTCILCIMVLEHIHQPRELLGDLMRASKQANCPLFVSVPWFNHNWWPYLLSDASSGSFQVGSSFHPLAQPDVHVTHFSHAGFKAACRDFGATEFEQLTAGGWTGFVVR